METETSFEDGDDIGFGENQEQESGEVSLPPLASNGDINLWLDEDKNGDAFIRIDAPFLESEPVFFDDAAKPTLNKFVEKWREKRSQAGE